MRKTSRKKYFFCEEKINRGRHTQRDQWTDKTLDFLTTLACEVDRTGESWNSYYTCQIKIYLFWGFRIHVR